MIPTSRLSSFLLFLAFLPVVAWGQSVSKPAAKTAAKTTVAPASNKSSGTKTDTKKSVAAPAVKAKDSGKANAVKPVKEAAEPKEKEMTPAQLAQAQKAAKAEKVKRPRILRDADDYYNAKEYFKAITLGLTATPTDIIEVRPSSVELTPFVVARAEAGERPRRVLSGRRRAGFRCPRSLSHSGVKLDACEFFRKRSK